MFRLRSCVLASVVALSGCSSPASPVSATASPSASPLVLQARADFHGEWRVAGPLTECSGGRDCNSLIGRTMAPRTLRLDQIGDAVTGVLIDDNGLVTEVRGSVDAAGLLTLSGSMPAAGAGDCPGGYQLTDFSVSLSGGKPSGKYRLLETASNRDCYPEPVRQSTTTVDVHRMVLKPQ